MSSLRRDQWEWPENRTDDGIVITSGDNGLTITIEEEQAVSSYNAQVTTSVVLPPASARALLAWLQSVAGGERS